MSSKRQSGSFEPLRRFLLRQVRQTGKHFGIGSYGSVEELDVDGLLCAGKKLHNALVEWENDGVEAIVRRFVEECSLLSNLRHPHIVQFLGVCFVEGSTMPVLVMEYLPHCLDTMLESNEDLPLGLKHSILSDVARGLIYLHGNTPPIIHRDLTAKNVLLNLALVAKIADLGVSRIVDIPPGQLTASMTQTPGTLAYMPPEALEEDPKYSTALDIFSFGHLALYTVIQDFPFPTSATYSDRRNPKILVARSEPERRARHIEKLWTQLGKRHPLVQVITQCLQNDQDQRPTAQWLLQQLEGMKSEVQGPYESMSRLELIMALREKEGQGSNRTSATLRAQMSQIQAQLRSTVAENRELQLQKGQVEEELRAVRSVVGQYQSTIQKLQAEARSREKQIREDQPPRKETAFPNQILIPQQVELLQSLKWRSCSEMAFAASGGNAVILNGNVYIGGVGADSEEDEYLVQVYNHSTDTWSFLCRCPVRFFSLTTLDNLLVLVGGLDKYSLSAAVLAWNDTLGQWMQIYPNMPTPRMLPAAIGYRRFLVVAGGSTMEVMVNTVEVLDTVNGYWSTATPLPIGIRQPSVAVIGETLYLLGGKSESASSKKALSVSLADLVSPRHYGESCTWNVLPDTPLVWSTAASMGTTLITVGGRDGSDRHQPAIYYHNSMSGKWVDIGGVMPRALSSCTCAVLPSGELIVAGGVGSDGELFNSVFAVTSYRQLM